MKGQAEARGSRLLLRETATVSYGIIIFNNGIPVGGGSCSGIRPLSTAEGFLAEWNRWVYAQGKEDNRGGGAFLTNHRDSVLSALIALIGAN
jgi:hypothetical protein